MVDDIRAEVTKEGDELRRRDVDHLQPRARVNLLALADRQVIHDDDLVAEADVRVHNVRPDEPRAAGYHDPHAASTSHPAPIRPD